jgi:hypothetical protein
MARLPARQLERQLGHPGALAFAALAVEGGCPGALGQGQTGVAHALVEVEAHREAQTAGGDRLEEVVGRPGRVAAHQGAAVQGALR